MLCHVFPPRSQFSSSPSVPIFCPQNACHPSAQFWRCAPEEDVLTQDQLDGWEDVEGVVHHQGLSYVPEIIWTELTSRHHDEGTLASRKLEESLPGKSTRPAVATNTCPPVTTWAGLPMSTDWKVTSYHPILVVISRLDRQQLRLSFHLQVLVPPVPLSSSTAVTTYASSTRTLNRNLMAAWT